MSKTLFVTWQDSKSRRWYPVGRLSCKGNVYEFVYTNGAKDAFDHAGFTMFGRMQSLDEVYTSNKLFPLFANRLLEKSRPEYKDFIKWLDLEGKDVDPFVVLSLTEGLRGTDNLEVLPCPEKTIDNNYELVFFSRSLSHCPPHSVECVNKLKPADSLFLMHDMQNAWHSYAIAIRTIEPITFVGYCPRYLCNDFHQILKSQDVTNCKISVCRVNTDAPTQLRLLCHFKAPWPADFTPCSSVEFLPYGRR